MAIKRLLLLLMLSAGICSCICYAVDDTVAAKAPEYANDIAVIDDAAIHRSFERHARDMIAADKLYSIDEINEDLGNRFYEVSLPEFSDYQKNPESIYNECSESVFAVGTFGHCGSKKCKKWHKNGGATGFFITETGIAVTNYHVMNKNGQGYMAVMTRDEKVYPISKVLACDPNTDIAIIQIDGLGEKFRPLSIAPYAPVGSDVYVIQNPKSSYYTMTGGKISRYFKRSVVTGSNKQTSTLSGSKQITMMAITADFCKGSSGGPVLDKYGRAVGMVKSTSQVVLKAQNQASTQMVFKYCVQAEDILKLVDEEFKEVQEQVVEQVETYRYEVLDTLEIDQVPSGFPVRFCLLTEGRRQYVAYYDQMHRMTVASRLLDSDEWVYKVLDTKIGWDSHNYITMAIDQDGQLHVSGNMHCVKLIYFRTQKPGDITTLKRYDMTGEFEDRVTYPKFLANQKGELVYTYRDGGSGNGRRLYNIYDPNTSNWSRLLEKPLFDGKGLVNAYPMGPVHGPEGMFHVVWVWRQTPDCATNHNLSYVKSKDLIEWESVCGQKIELPITPDKKSLCVDPIPSGGGIINGGFRVLFDMNNRPVIAYHKSDQNSNMQIYAARFEDEKWVVRQLTEWDKPVEFSGHGSMGFIGISLGKLERVEEGILTVTYNHKDYGNGRVVIDEKTLQPIDKKIKVVKEYPQEMNRRQIKKDGFGIQRAGDSGSSGDENVRYVLQWETLGKNHDRPRTDVEPKSSVLKLYKLVKRSDCNQ